MLWPKFLFDIFEGWTLTKKILFLISIYIKMILILRPFWWLIFFCNFFIADVCTCLYVIILLGLTLYACRLFWKEIMYEHRSNYLQVLWFLYFNCEIWVIKFTPQFIHWFLQKKKVSRKLKHFLHMNAHFVNVLIKMLRFATFC